MPNQGPTKVSWSEAVPVTRLIRSISVRGSLAGVYKGISLQSPWTLSLREGSHAPGCLIRYPTSQSFPIPRVFGPSLPCKIEQPTPPKCWRNHHLSDRHRTGSVLAPSLRRTDGVPRVGIWARVVRIHRKVYWSCSLSLRTNRSGRVRFRDRLER